ncbi:MAG: hypothetical protein WAO56_10465 [Miniphocaeibacter sp.]|uniref:hypothetical protein n=1 Tax=Miniphocaeibacter sp. TaxID=3100973 RepID=UPI00181C50BD|nr:hypothetical protein [Gallicola sp.]
MSKYEKENKNGKIEKIIKNKFLTTNNNNYNNKFFRFYTIPLPVVIVQFGKSRYA